MRNTLAVLFFVSLGTSSLVAQNYKTYTLYIHGFAKFVLWPEDDKKTDFEIVVLGESPLTAELLKMKEKKKVGDRAFKVIKINSMSEFRNGHMLFIPSTLSDQLTEVLTKVGNKSTMVITEQPGLGAKGSDVNFVMKDGKLAFELNQVTLAKHKLKASTELTRLAIVI
ncbi:MAG: YfiR family protein [Cyclobacteriaceae bacterium]|nr:YfiR family protein [Cyclobacteriaceae bacterium]